MIAHAGEYGVVTVLSQRLGVSRQTLYTWCDRGVQALVAAFTPASSAADGHSALALLTEIQASALPAQQAEVQGRHRQVTQALPGLLAFTDPLDALQGELATVLGTAGLHPHAGTRLAVWHNHRVFPRGVAGSIRGGARSS